MLSILGTDFIAHWAYAERISAHAQPAVKCEQFLHVQYMLSIRGTNFIAHWAYAEQISSHAEHARKCLKVEYLGQIKYDFQKSCVTGPWDHMVSVSAKKFKKFSCLCTFKGTWQWTSFSYVFAFTFRAFPILASNSRRYSKNDSPYRWVGESTRLPTDTNIFKPLNNTILIVNYIPDYFLAKMIL